MIVLQALGLVAFFIVFIFLILVIKRPQILKLLWDDRETIIRDMKKTIKEGLPQIIRRLFY